MGVKEQQRGVYRDSFSLSQSLDRVLFLVTKSCNKFVFVVVLLEVSTVSLSPWMVSLEACYMWKVSFEVFCNKVCMCEYSIG